MQGMSWQTWQQVVNSWSCLIKYVTAMLAIMLAATLAFKINNTSDSLGS